MPRQSQSIKIINNYMIKNPKKIVPLMMLGIISKTSSLIAFITAINALGFIYSQKEPFININIAFITISIETTTTTYIIALIVFSLFLISGITNQVYSKKFIDIIYEQNLTIRLNQVKIRKKAKEITNRDDLEAYLKRKDPIVEKKLVNTSIYYFEALQNILIISLCLAILFTLNIYASVIILTIILLSITYLLLIHKPHSLKVDKEIPPSDVDTDNQEKSVKNLLDNEKRVITSMRSSDYDSKKFGTALQVVIGILFSIGIIFVYYNNDAITAEQATQFIIFALITRFIFGMTQRTLSMIRNLKNQNMLHEDLIQ